MEIKVSKVGKFLQFDVDGKVVKYDLSTGESISHHGNVVKTVAHYFRGSALWKVIDAFDDENYKRWFHYVRGNEPRLTNMGSLLKAVRRYGAHLEQFYASGVKCECDPPEEPVDSKLIRACKKFDIAWDGGIQKLFNAVGIDHFSYIIERGHKDVFTCWYGFDNLVKLLENGYDVTQLVKYIEYLQFVEGVPANDYLIRDIADYWEEAEKVSTNPSRYPRNFKTVKGRTSYHYGLNRDKYDEESFAQKVDKRSDRLEWTHCDYTIVYPKMAEDIRTEGKDLSHCVASYVDNVIAGNTHIVFMRMKDKPEESLVTVQLSPTFKVLQARGYENRNLESPELDFLDKYEAWLESPKSVAAAARRAEARKQAQIEQDKIDAEAEAIAEAHPEYEQVA